MHDDTNDTDDAGVADADELGNDDLSVEDAAVDLLPSSGLLSFYDRLRQHVVDFLEERGGSLGETASHYLLLVPDVFILLVRLALDKRVPKAQRALIGSALAYFVMPIDLLPEVFVGPLGYLDDLVLAAAVVSRAFGDELESFTDQHWSGSDRLRKVIADIADTAENLVGKNVYGKLVGLLKKKGIDLDAKPN